MLYTRLERQPEKPEKGSHWLRVLPVGLNSWRIWNKQTFTGQGDEVSVSSGPPLRPGSSCLRQPPADLTTVSFCTEQSSCIMLCSVHVCALASPWHFRRAPHGAVSTRAHPWLASLAQETASDFRIRGLCPMPDGPHAPPGKRLARCSGDTPAALDAGITPGRPRGDHSMAQVHRVYFLGNLTRNPGGAVCAERHGGGAVGGRRANPHPPGGHLARRRLLYRCGRIRAPGRNDWSLSVQRPRRPDRGALAVAAVGAGGAVPQ